MTVSKRTASRSEPAETGEPGWRLQDAKARFAEVVRLAREVGPQRVTVHGPDTVVVLSGEEYDSLRKASRGGRRVIDALLAMPQVEELDLERPDYRPPVRDVEL